MFDYHCDNCGYDLFIEEGYDEELDTVFCPKCGYCVEDY